MPRPVCITYDSTCDLTPRLLERFHIRTVPLTIQSGERIFLDDGCYTSAELYADYRRNGTLPKTTAVSPEEFKAFFSPLLAEGYDIVHIDISSELSCTCQNAVLAAQELAEQGRIHVVDSRQLSTGGGLLALQGAVLRDSGMAAADIAEELRRLAPHSDTSFVLDTLEYMWKGGRCSGRPSTCTPACPARSWCRCGAPDGAAPPRYPPPPCRCPAARLPAAPAGRRRWRAGGCPPHGSAPAPPAPAPPERRSDRCRTVRS